ncbi:hypothetical protein ACEPAI_1423 [Sanghuangporus weigelae]
MLYRLGFRGVSYTRMCRMRISSSSQNIRSYAYTAPACDIDFYALKYRNEDESGLAFLLIHFSPVFSFPSESSSSRTHLLAAGWDSLKGDCDARIKSMRLLFPRPTKARVESKE